MRYLLSTTIVLVTCTAWGDTATIGPNGVNSKVTGLDGTGIEIGQLESSGRSAKFNYDTDDTAPPFTKRVATNTNPTRVYFGPSGGINGQDAMNSSNISTHATEVAQVMIGTAGPQEGVAPFANLYSAGFSGDDENAAAVLNRLATISGTNLQGKPIKMRAINLSFGRESQPPVETLDGQEYLTQFMDWSASHQDITYTTAWGNSDSFPNRVPQDNFNAIKVAASEKPMGENVFRQFSSSNATEGDPAGGNRSGIDILAPGHDVNLLDPGDMPVQVSGSSVAAPHVTGAVALLQQFARTQMEPPISNPRFTSRSQRHEVMKAVLLNSADKKSGVHGSTRTVKLTDEENTDWEHSQAFTSDFVSLDSRMGAGLMNVGRAKTQFATGEYDPGSVPSIGWDYGTIGGEGSRTEYVLDQGGGGGYIAVTLIWDRRVESSRPGNTWQFGDQFFRYENISEVLNNLNVYLMPVGDNDLAHAVAASFASEDNVEHIFKDVGAGNFKIVVANEAGGIGDSQNYGIAWWWGSGATAPPGDYNKNGSVGPEDYDVWKTNFGTNFADADGNGDGIVDAGDYTIWRDNLGAGSGSLAAVPEPSSAMLLAIAGVLVGWRNRERPASNAAGAT